MVQEASSYWDYEWDYTMGKLEEQTGLSLDHSGTGGSSLISDGEKITTNSGAFFQPYFTSGGIHSNLRTMPDGYGTMVFRSAHRIDSRDDQGRVAQSGDKVKGNYINGHLEYGTWIKASGGQEEIFIGQ